MNEHPVEDPVGDLGARLEALCEAMDAPARLAADPVSYPHRYEDPRDQEVAAVLASALAYGRVAAFRSVLDRLFAIADDAGGPGTWVDRFDPERDGAVLRSMYYRWNRGVDFVLLLSALKLVYRSVPSLEAHLVGDTLVDGLGVMITAIRGAAIAEAGACGVSATFYNELPRGFRTMLPHPANGSACKRWFLFLRWMIRPADGVDLGLWTTRRPAELIVPLDTHVARVSRFLGLTTRTDDSLRTALEITAALRRFDPDDPIRFDFALAHLGISGACRGHRDEEVCPGCPLHEVCVAE